MLILGLLGMYFDAAVVFVTNSSLFFRLAVAILWGILYLICKTHLRIEMMLRLPKIEAAFIEPFNFENAGFEICMSSLMIPP